MNLLALLLIDVNKTFICENKGKDKASVTDYRIHQKVCKTFYAMQDIINYVIIWNVKNKIPN